MARNPSSFAKRQRELQRQQKRAEKARKRASRSGSDDTPRAAGEEDPDIAGIVPGPQAQPWMDGDVDGPDDAELDEYDDYDEDAPSSP